MTDGRHHNNFDKFHWAAVHADVYAPGDSVVLNGKIYVANDAATKGAAVDYSVSPEAGDGSLTSDWVSAETREPIEEYESLADLLAADLPVGALAETAYHTVVDQGGGAMYQIIAADDGYSDASLNGYAKIQERVPDMRQFGAISNDSTFDNLPVFDRIQQHVLRGKFTVSGTPTVSNNPALFYTSGTLVLQNQRVCESTSNLGNVQFMCMAGFTDPYLSKVGEDAEVTVLNTNFKNIVFHTSSYGATAGFPNVIPGFSNSVNENSGWFYCRLNSFETGAMRIEPLNFGAGAGSPKNFNMYGNEFFRKQTPTGNTDPVVYIQSVQTSHNSLANCTVVGQGFGTTGDPAISGISVGPNTFLSCENFHLESCVDGIVAEAQSSTLVLSNINGPDSASAGFMTNLVRRKTGSHINARGLARKSAAATMRDDFQDYSFTDANLDYLASRGGVNDQVIMHSSPYSGNPRRIPNVITGAYFEECFLRGDVNHTVLRDNRNIVMDFATNTVFLPNIAPMMPGGNSVKDTTVWNTSSGDVTIEPSGTDAVYQGGVAVTAGAPFTLPSRMSVKVRAVHTTAESAWYIGIPE